MTQNSTLLPVHSAAPRQIGPKMVPPRTDPSHDSTESLPLWTAARIDLARRLWSKGISEEEILAAINHLPGAHHATAQALVELAERLCWPNPRRPRPLPRLRTRDGSPSVTELEAGRPLSEEAVELPMEDAIAWGRANGVVRHPGESDAALLQRINRARQSWQLPRFRITRYDPARIKSEMAAPPLTIGLTRPTRRKRAPGSAVRV